VVRPRPFDTRRSPLPSTFITYSWSQPLRTLSVRWKISRLPSGAKYASAFSPPKVSCRMLRRWCSPGSGST
jgi:hypothetical protein